VCPVALGGLLLLSEKAQSSGSACSLFRGGNLSGALSRGRVLHSVRLCASKIDSRTGTEKGAGAAQMDLLKRAAVLTFFFFFFALPNYPLLADCGAGPLPPTLHSASIMRQPCAHTIA